MKRRAIPFTLATILLTFGAPVDSEAIDGCSLGSPITNTVMLTTTVSTNASCGVLTDTILMHPGLDVTFCYDFAATNAVTVTVETLFDDVLGFIKFNNLTLGVGNNFEGQITATIPITFTQTSVVTATIHRDVPPVGCGNVVGNAAAVLVCGDGIVSSNEGCDDGNNTSGDGCSANCLVETNFTCSGQPSVCDDGDDVAPAIEDAVNPFMDGNGDGIDDKYQPNVTSVPAATGQGYITLETDCAGGNKNVAAQGLPAPDPSFDYPFGLLTFELPCQQAHITIYYNGTTSLPGAEYRKNGPMAPLFGPPQFYTLPTGAPTNVVFGTDMVEGQQVGKVDFDLTNGLIGDDTPAADNTIFDQGGPGLRIAAAPALSSWGLVLASLLLIGAAFFGLRRRETWS